MAQNCQHGCMPIAGFCPTCFQAAICEECGVTGANHDRAGKRENVTEKPCSGFKLSQINIKLRAQTAPTCPHGTKSIPGLCAACFGSPLYCADCKQPNIKHNSTDGSCSTLTSNTFTLIASKKESMPTDKSISGSVQQSAQSGLKNEFLEASWLVAAGTATKTAKAAIVGALQRHVPEGDTGTRAAIANFIEGPFGDLFVALGLSAALNSAGSLLGDKMDLFNSEKVSYLASRVRVMAMAQGGQNLVNELMDPLLEAMKGFLKDMPELPAEPKLLTQTERVQGPNVTEKDKVAA